MDARTNLQIAQDNFTASDLWDAAFVIAQQIPGFKTYRMTPALTPQPDELPMLSVYLMRETRVPMGDADAGEPKFIHQAHLGFSGMIAASNIDTQLRLVAEGLDALDIALLTTYSEPGEAPTFIELIRGFESADRKLVFSRQGETPMIEFQEEFVVSFETIWPPNVPDDYKRLHVDLQYPTPPTGAPQTGYTWDIDQDELSNEP